MRHRHWGAGNRNDFGCGGAGVALRIPTDSADRSNRGFNAGALVALQGFGVIVPCATQAVTEPRMVTSALLAGGEVQSP